MLHDSNGVFELVGGAVKLLLINETLIFLPHCSSSSSSPSLSPGFVSSKPGFSRRRSRTIRSRVKMLESDGLSQMEENNGEGTDKVEGLLKGGECRKQQCTKKGENGIGDCHHMQLS
ncbi:hypothetical protein AKJ16_DCAP00653 [Drosera capensis]